MTLEGVCSKGSMRSSADRNIDPAPGPEPPGTA